MTRWYDLFQVCAAYSKKVFARQMENSAGQGEDIPGVLLRGTLRFFRPASGKDE